VERQIGENLASRRVIGKEVPIDENNTCHLEFLVSGRVNGWVEDSTDCAASRTDMAPPSTVRSGLCACRRKRQWMALQPKDANSGGRIDPSFIPPSKLHRHSVAPRDDAPTEWNDELIADLTPECR
jgi:hypothetical protein